MNKKELRKAFDEKYITEGQYKQALFQIELQPKQPRKAKRLPVCVSYEEFEAIIKVTKDKKYKLATLLALMSGLRINEVISLTPPSEEDFRQKTLRIIGKGNKERTVPLPKGFKRDYMPLMPLIKNFKNAPSAVRSIQIGFKRAAKRAGITDYKPTVHFHSLRHGFATHALDKNIPIHNVRTLMGHANISTTNVYLESNPKKAIENYQELF